MGSLVNPLSILSCLVRQQRRCGAVGGPPEKLVDSDVVVLAADGERCLGLFHQG